MKRLVIILLFAMLLVAGLMVVSKSLDSSGSYAVLTQARKEIIPVPTEHWSNETWNASKYEQNTFEEWVPKKTLDEYYKHRAYYGAPPFIPHPIQNEMSMGGGDCLKCHEFGGYVKQFEAFAPVVPHPEKVNCRQCHAEVLADGEFRPTNWENEKRKPVSIHNQALQGSPPTIPHALDMRKDCLSCHSGPSAPEEIRVSHPERINCRQCHALNKQDVTINDFVKELK